MIKKTKVRAFDAIATIIAIPALIGFSAIQFYRDNQGTAIYAMLGALGLWMFMLTGNWIVKQTEMQEVLTDLIDATNRLTTAMEFEFEERKRVKDLLLKKMEDLKNGK